MAENKLADLFMDFAVKILKMTDGIKVHYSLINQLERSATSIAFFSAFWYNILIMIDNSFLCDCKI